MARNRGPLHVPSLEEIENLRELEDSLYHTYLTDMASASKYLAWKTAHDRRKETQDRRRFNLLIIYD